MTSTTRGRARRFARRAGSPRSHAVAVPAPVFRPPRLVVRREAGLAAYEAALTRAGFGPVAGADEAGRGACAGPLVVAACILPPGRRGQIDGLDDSKALTAAERERLGIVPLPVDQAAALAALEADAAARSWFSDDLVTTHLAVRRSEAAQLAGLSPEEACRRYAAVI